MKVPVYSPSGERLEFCSAHAAARRAFAGEGILRDGGLHLKLRRDSLNAKLRIPVAEDNYTTTRGRTIEHHRQRCAAYGPAVRAGIITGPSGQVFSEG